MFQAGMLRERITIRRRGETKNAVGGLDVGWTTVASNLAARLVNLNGREAVIGGVLQGISMFDITVRYRTDLKPSDQVLWGLDPSTGKPRELNVINAEDRLGSRQWTMIQATTQTPQGA
jgi:head-tail adaptor